MVAVPEISVTSLFEGWLNVPMAEPIDDEKSLALELEPVTPIRALNLSTGLVKEAIKEAVSSN